MKPVHIDALVDAVYGVLILVAVAVMLVGGGAAGIAFGVGVLISYLIHVFWKMARFDPDWMTRVEETVETVENTVEGTVQETIEETLEEREHETEVDARADSGENRGAETGLTK